MSTTANNTYESYYFRRRAIGRAASPATWACYEQIRYDDEDYSDSDFDSCSEDDENYHSHVAPHRHDPADESENDQDPTRDGGNGNGVGVDSDDIDMDMDEEGDGQRLSQNNSQQHKDVKGKQKAVDPEPEVPPRNRRQPKTRRQYTLRPILTIQRSQGFVWNQDLFVPPYIKDRYIASTSPPNSRGFISTSASSTNSALTDYEVEVVEIRIKEGEIHDIIP